MDFALTEEQQLIRTEVGNLARKFDWSYWRELDSTGEYPHAFFNEMASAGWVGAAIPTEYGGGGLGIIEASLILLEICASGAGTFGGISGALFDVSATAGDQVRQRGDETPVLAQNR